jgi:hypothetical protein
MNDYIKFKNLYTKNNTLYFVLGIVLGIIISKLFL